MTTNEIQVFSNSQFGDIRTIIAEDGEPRFCLVDICRVLGVQVQNTKRRLNVRGVYSINTPTNGGEQSLLFVSEQNLYKVIMRSDKPQAEPFQDWVCGEVLPSIRKTGGYIATKHDDTPEEIMARALVVAQSTLERQQKRLQEQTITIERQEQQIQEQHRELQAAAPKVSYYDDTLMSSNTLTMTQAANAIGLSVYALTDKLQKAGIIYRQSGQIMLRVPFCQWGLHKTRTNTYTRSNGEIGTSIYMVWTQKGLRFINELRDRDFNVTETVAALRKAKAEVTTVQVVQ